MNPAPPTIVITPRRLTSLTEWRELWAARDLLWFLVRRDLKTRYSQSVLGLGWVVVQPLFTMGVLTLVFGKLAGLSSDGAPKAVWSLTAVVLWTFFQSAVNETGNCLAANIGMITKVYFARLVLPLAGVAGKLFDLLIMLGLLAVVLVANLGNAAIHPQLDALWMVPAALMIVTLATLALGLCLAGLAVQYRDVRVAQGFLLQLFMFASPVVYSSNDVPDNLHVHSIILNHFRTFYFCNPLAGAIEAMRASLLGVEPHDHGIIALHLLQGAVISILGLLLGLWCFRRAEQVVADVA